MIQNCQEVNPKIAAILVDPVTRKDTGVMYEGDSIQRDSQNKFTRENMPWKRPGYVKSYTDELKLVLPQLTTIEKALFLSILPYVAYLSCCIQDREGRDIGLNEMERISGMAKKTVIKALQGLVDKDVLYRGKNSKKLQVFANPWLVASGAAINKTLKTMFKNYKIRSKEGVTWQEYEKKYLRSIQRNQQRETKHIQHVRAGQNLRT